MVIEQFLSDGPSRQNFWQSVRAAGRGLIYVYKTQRSFRLQSWLAALAVGMGFYLKIRLTEFIILMVFITLVLLAEITNTALETTLDLVTKKLRFKVKIAKDAAAGGVFLASVAALIFGLIIFGQKILALLGLFK